MPTEPNSVQPRAAAPTQSSQTDSSQPLPPQPSGLTPAPHGEDIPPALESPPHAAVPLLPEPSADHQQPNDPMDTDAEIPDAPPLKPALRDLKGVHSPLPSPLVETPQNSNPLVAPGPSPIDPMDQSEDNALDRKSHV